MSSKGDDGNDEPRSGDGERAVMDPQLVEQRVSRATELCKAAGFGQLPREELLEELKECHYNVELVLEGYVRRRKAEGEKGRGNALFAACKYEAAAAAYTAGIALCGCGALDVQLRAVLNGNCSASLLAMGRAEDALRHAEAATLDDPANEKCWLRLGAAHDALGHRRPAFQAFQKARSNTVAAKQSAELRVPPVVVTEYGLGGAWKNTVFLDPSNTYYKPTKFFKRLLLPGEPLVKGEVRLESFDYVVRKFMLDKAEEMRDDKEGSVERRIVWTQRDDKQKFLRFDIIGSFVSLYKVFEDGRSRLVAPNATVIPVLLVALWIGKGEPPPGDQQPATVVCDNVDRVQRIVLCNTLLLSDATKQSIPVPRGFVLSVMTHVPAPELDYSVLEGCSVPGCEVECAANRCGRCYVARYCGEEHMKAHWREHKKLCVPLQQRTPALIFDCSHSYLVFGGDDREFVKKTFPGVMVVKVQMTDMHDFTICDAHGVLSLNQDDIVLDSRNNESFEKLKQLLLQLGTVSPADKDGNSDAFGYFDADMSVENRLIIYLDRAWKCTW
jgi:hypothetical protein